jgi:hypothetical protein
LRPFLLSSSTEDVLHLAADLPGVGEVEQPVDTLADGPLVDIVHVPSDGLPRANSLACHRLSATTDSSFVPSHAATLNFVWLYLCEQTFFLEILLPY